MDKHIISFIEKNFVGLVSTLDGEQAYGSPVYYCFDEVEKSFYFITKTKSKKFSNLSKNNKASFAIFSEKPPAVYSAECLADILDFDREVYPEIIKKLVEVHSSQEYYPSPIATIDEGTLKLLKLNIVDEHFKSYALGISNLTTA